MEEFSYLVYIGTVGLIGAVVAAYVLYRERHPRKTSRQ